MHNKNITVDKVKKDYKNLKKLSKKYYLKNEMNNAMDSVTILAKLMYCFNIFYTDNDVENLLKEISTKIFKNDVENSKIEKNKNKVIFYDSFGQDNRVLTEQYLEALIQLEYDILYITLQKDEKIMKNILKKLKNYERAEVYKIKAKNKVEICKEIRKKAFDYQATKIFIQITPWDTIGMVTWCYFENKAERYNINLTDHAFWLGKCCSDYFIEFRSYGKNISIDYRGIKEEKSAILPYYPIQSSEELFQGFSFETEGKKMIFSGGTLYKIYGSLVFFEIVKHILNNHEDVIFLFLGNGNEKPIQKFIIENNYQNKFYHLNERRDINEVFKRCYFYLGTYPISGGLMSQFAIANGKLPIAYTTKKLPVNQIEELFIDSENIKLTYFDLQEMKNEIDKLLKYPDYLKKKTENIEKLVISKKEFSEELKKLIETKKTRFKFEKYGVDIKEFSALYFEQENKFINQYKRIFLTKNLKIGLKFYKNFIPSLIEYVFIKIKKKIRGK